MYKVISLLKVTVMKVNTFHVNGSSPAVEWVYLKMFVKVFFSFDYSNIGVL